MKNLFITLCLLLAVNLLAEEKITAEHAGNSFFEMKMTRRILLAELKEENEQKFEFFNTLKDENYQVYKEKINQYMKNKFEVKEIHQQRLKNLLTKYNKQGSKTVAKKVKENITYTFERRLKLEKIYLNLLNTDLSKAEVNFSKEYVDIDQEVEKRLNEIAESTKINKELISYNKLEKPQKILPQSPKEKATNEVKALAFIKAYAPEEYLIIAALKKAEPDKFYEKITEWDKKFENHKEIYNKQVVALYRKCKKLKNEAIYDNLKKIVKNELLIELKMRQFIIKFKQDDYQQAVERLRKRKEQKATIIKERLKYLLRDQDLDW